MSGANYVISLEALLKRGANHGLEFGTLATQLLHIIRFLKFCRD